jgi:hypothetical protein
MVNSTATASAGPAAPTPEQIKRYLVPISFLKRVWNVVSGIFSKDSLKTLWDVKYKIKPEVLQHSHNVRTNKEALDTIAKLCLNIEKSDCVSYLGNWTTNEIDCYLKHGVALI